MSLLSPSMLLLGLLAVPILLLYMLKLRRREFLVSSNYLWEMVLRDRQANAPWQRLKRNLLLFLQLLILAALIFALARPALPASSIASGSLVVLLDASASMNATDVAPSRFEAARSAARTLIDELDSNAHMSIILVARQPQVLASAENDKTVLRQALEKAAPSQGAADWQAAMALAAGAASTGAEGNAGKGSTIAIISDGGLPSEGLPPLPGEVRYIPIGKGGDNLAVSALSLRPAGSGAELFARFTNDGSSAQPALISFYRDNQLFRSQAITIPAHDSSSVTLPDLPAAPATYQARLSSPDGSNKPLDSLPLDDAAFAVYRPIAGRRVLLITENPKGNLFLEQVLAAMPGIQPFRAVRDPNGQVQIPKEPFDLYVMDGVITGTLPGGNMLLVNPPSNTLFQVGGVLTVTAATRVTEHPLTRFVDWKNVHIAKYHQVIIPAWATGLIQAGDNPLVFAGETGGKRIAAITFDLHDSDLPLQVAFPILFSNLIDYLAPGQAFQAADGLQPGDSLSILPDPSVSQVAVVTPNEKVISLAPKENGVSFQDTGELGVYAVNYLGKSSLPAEYFAVNLFNPSESNILPARTIQIGRAAISASQRSEISQRELWPYLTVLALAVLMVEWWFYHRSQGWRLNLIRMKPVKNTGG